MPFRRVLFRSEEHTSELQSHDNLVCRLLLEKKKNKRPGKRVFCESVASRIRSARARPRRSAPGTAPSRPVTIASLSYPFCFFFFFNDTATTEIYTLSLHDALPI